ncbi:MAG: hypothetical protein GF418_12095 [Chitinivibrionales bacterium]|nr:hypothetical protein [Chitinivibrionales bacterium]MBD3396359.1 hypothetical protein [Chitinivibrionales bacterium]
MNWICASFLLIVSIAWQTAAAAFVEEDGLVVVECESVPPGSEWQLRTGAYDIGGGHTTAGASCNACYHFTGNAENSGGVTGEMLYPIKITNPGMYVLHMLVMEAPVESNDGTWANDCYIKMEGQTEGCDGNFTKYVYLGGSFSWGWDPKIECGQHNFVTADYDLDAGIHNFYIAGRSKNFLVDRFVLAKSSVSNPTDLSLPLSSLDDGSEQTCGGGGDWTPTVIESPAEGTSLVMGSTITLEGTGDNLSWSYDANSDGEGNVSIGTGNTAEFEVPTGVDDPKTITITAVGDGGSASRTYDLLDQGVTVVYDIDGFRRQHRSKSTAAFYTLDGRRLRARSLREAAASVGMSAVVLVRNGDGATAKLLVSDLPR